MVRTLSFKGKRKNEDKLIEAAMDGDIDKLATLIGKCSDVSKPRDDGCE